MEDVKMTESKLSKEAETEGKTKTTEEKDVLVHKTDISVASIPFKNEKRIKGIGRSPSWCEIS